MHVLFVHQNFPAQFRYIAPRLVAEHEWRCTFVTEKAEGELPGVEKIVYKARGGATRANHYCTRNFENAVAHTHGVYEALKARPDIQPDLVVAHTGFGSSLFVPYLCDAPIINFLEYFYHPVGQDMGFRPESPVTEEDLLRIKTKNAMILLDLVNCDRGWTPTHYQREFFPPQFHDKIEVIFDGIDTDVYHRKDNPNRRIGERQYIGPHFRIVTYVARGFEMMRGFDIFMKAAKRIYEQFPDVVFVVVGTDRVHYGGDLKYIEEKSFRHHVLAQEEFDLSKFRFTGYVPQETLADILSISDLHIYLTEPFIASWSMVDAMSCGAVVLASDQRCVREYITHGKNGLLCDFFDYEGLARQAVEVLKDPPAYRQLADAAQRTVEEEYSLSVALPRIKELLERVATNRREPSVRTALLVRPGTRYAARSADRDAAPEVADRFQGGTGVEEPEAVTSGSAGGTGSASGTRRVALAQPVGHAGADAVRDPELEQAIAILRQLSGGAKTIQDWIKVAQGFRGPAPRFTQLGPPNHPTDLARLMQRLREWKVELVVDLGTRDGGTLLLWSRVATDHARIIAVGLPGRPFPEDKVPFFQAMARGKQNILCIPSAINSDALERQIDQARSGKAIDFLFLDGLRPYQELKADFLRLRNRVRKDGLIAWSGIGGLVPPAPSEDGGYRLWAEMQPLYPRHAEYLEGALSPSGGIAMIRV